MEWEEMRLKKQTDQMMQDLFDQCKGIGFRCLVQSEAFESV